MTTQTETTHSGDTLTTLLADLVDYAGLFPPAQLDMAAAVAEYARQRRSRRQWMLARFVVPVSRLGELAEAAKGVQEVADRPWPLSVLTPGDPRQSRRTLDDFLARHGDAFRAEAIEHRPASPEAVADAAEAFSGIEVFYELPHQDADLDRWMAAVAAVGGHAKIRSGGVTADAFPSSAEVARFLETARDHGVALKATAGLHHPLRGEYRLTYADDSPSGTMHGFLNVFLTAAALHANLVDTRQAEELLDELDDSAFDVDPDGIVWRGLLIPTAALTEGRQGFALSYGSCSFAEPVEELESLGFLTP